VLRGIYVLDSHGVEIDDDLWYRITEAGVQFVLDSQQESWKQESKPDASCEDNESNSTVELVGTTLTAGSLYLIGDECDPHAPGALLVSWPNFEDVFIDDAGDNGCPPPIPDNQNCLYCCQGDAQKVGDLPECTHPDTGSKPFSYFWATYGQGGISGLEFSDEPSPYLP